MVLKIWSDVISGPCRTILFILKKLKLEYEIVDVQIIKDTRTEEFKKINPAQVVPVVEVDGEKLYESASIARYLLDVNEGDEALLPRSDLLARAKVDAILDWVNTTGRPQLINAAFVIKLNPTIGKPEATEEEVKLHTANAHMTFKTIDETVKEKGGFLAGDHMTIADVQAYNMCGVGNGILQIDTSEYEGYEKWFKAMGEDEVLAELDEGMKKRLEG